MIRQDTFLDKLVAKMERLDTSSLQAQFLNLAREKGWMETVFQSIQEGILVVSGQGELQYANRAAESLLGLDAARMRGKALDKYLPEIDWGRLVRQDEEEWAKLVRSEIEISYPEPRRLSFYAVPIQGRGSASRPRDAREGSASPRDAGEGSASRPRDARPPEPCVLVMLRDVTHEHEEDTTRVESERINAVKYLASGLAHEIGNPLNSLGIHLQLLEREVDRISEKEGREDLKELVRIAREEVARLDLVNKQFLGALRPAAPVFVKGDVAESLKEVLQTLRSEIENRKVEVILKMKRDLPEVYVDGGQMKQVFFNLVKNAFQAMPGGGTLTVEFDADDRNVTVSIRDTGTGIPPEEFRRLFEPYRTTKASGHGLGLMIVQRIVQDHGGQIEVESKRGEGTVFRIVLPLAERRIRMLK